MDPELYRVLVSIGRTAKTFSLSAATFYGFDYCLTIGDEIELIHPSRWKLSKVLFMLNRYFPFALFPVHNLILFHPNPSDFFCTHGMRLTAVAGLVNQLLVNSVLLLRVWALYERSKIMLGFLLFLLTSAMGTAITFNVISYQTVHLRPKLGPPLPHITGCSMSFPTDPWRVLIPCLVYEVVIVILTLYRTWSLARSNIRVPVMQHVYESGLIHFTVMAGFMILSLVANWVPVLLTPTIASQFLVAITSVSCTRLLLMLRTVIHRQDQTSFFPTITQGTSYELQGVDSSKRTGNGPDTVNGVPIVRPVWEDKRQGDSISDDAFGGMAGARRKRRVSTDDEELGRSDSER